MHRAFLWMRTPAVGLEWLHAPAYMFMLYWSSSIADSPERDDLVGELFEWVSPQFQNLLHIPLYAVLYVLVTRVVRMRVHRELTILLTAFVITVSYGVFDEWHQSFVPGRYATMTDAVLNAIGAIVAGTVIWVLGRGRGRHFLSGGPET